MVQLYFAVSWALAGLIWVIQLVKYPAFHFVSENRFIEYHQHHTKSITFIVIPLMLLELFLSFWFCIRSGWSTFNVIGLSAVLAIWASTFFIQIPQHNILNKGKDEAAINKLVKTNWIRTVLWTGKGTLLFFT